MYDPLGSIKMNPDTVLGMLRTKIKEAKTNPSECVCKMELFTENNVEKTIRRVFVINHSYEVTWVVDSDVHSCMRCLKPFNNMYLRFRHHCRACGNLICAECSPYKTPIASLIDEEPMSRVCLNCFGLKVSVQDPEEFKKKQDQIAYEKSQRPINYAAYRTMRRLIPPNITRTNYQKLKALDIPESILNRIWNTKILWIICMHRDDLLKIHVADLRSRFATTGLDIVEMRAIWYNLPDWTINPKDFLKEEWKQQFKLKLSEMSRQEEDGTLPSEFKRHPAYDGYDDLVLFKVDVPIQQLFVGIHNQESKMPVIQESERRLSLSFGSDDEGEKVIVDPEMEELKKYLDDGTEHPEAFVENPTGFKVIEIEEDDDIITSPPVTTYRKRPAPLTSGISWMGYLSNNPKEVKIIRPTSLPINVSNSSSTNSSRSSSFSNMFTTGTYRQRTSSRMSDTTIDRASISTIDGNEKDIEKDIDKELDGWDMTIDDLPDSVPDVDEDIRNHVNRVVEKITGVRRSSSLLLDEGSNRQSLNLEKISEDDAEDDEADDKETLRKRSIHFMPSSEDKSLKEWRSPNLAPVPPGSPRPISLTRLSTPSSGNASPPKQKFFRESVSLDSSDGLKTRQSMIQVADEIDAELDNWKVPFGIDETLDGLNIEGANLDGVTTVKIEEDEKNGDDRSDKALDDRSSLGSVAARSSAVAYIAPKSAKKKPSVDASFLSPTPKARPSAAMGRLSFSKRLIHGTLPLYERKTPVSQRSSVEAGTAANAIAASVNKIAPNSKDSQSSRDSFYRADSDGELALYEGDDSPLSPIPGQERLVSSTSNLSPEKIDPPPRPSNVNAVISSPKIRKSNTPENILIPDRPVLYRELSNGEQTIRQPQPSVFAPFTKNKPAVFSSVDDHDDHTPVKTEELRELQESLPYAAKLEIITEYIRKGDAHNARVMVLKHKVTPEDVNVEEISRILLRCLKHVNDLEQPLETVRLLVESLNADVNYQDVRTGTGDTALMLVITKPNVGAFLIESGADIFLKNRNGDSALSLAISKQEWWLVEEFEDSPQKKEMLKDADETRMREYVSFLAFGGLAKQLKKHLDDGNVTITAAQASILFEECTSNFANMKEPVDTYEILMNLMGNML